MEKIKQTCDVLFDYYSQFKGKILGIKRKRGYTFILIKDIKLNKKEWNKIVRIAYKEYYPDDNKWWRTNWTNSNNLWLFNQEMYVFTEEEFNKQIILNKLEEIN